MNKIMISGTSSSVGKTTVTAAVLSLLDNVQPFKCGPDYIDPMFHEYVTRKPSYNLDLYMLGEDMTKYLFSKHAPKDGISVLEGMMGLYDGLGHEKDNLSAAHISRVLDAPVILIADGRKISTSIAAEVLGFIKMDQRVNICGVIINRVSESLYKYLKEAVEMHTGIPCVGYLPDDETIAVSERHLGLMQAQEIEDLSEKMSKLKETAKKSIDIEKIIELSASSDVICDSLGEKDIQGIYKGITVAVAKDKAFSFYYKDNIELMEMSGIDIKYFSPMEDEKIPEADFVYLGGGYPEIHAKKLSQNISMLNSIRKFINNGGTMYAECGGMMYLSDAVIDANGDEYKMAGIFTHKVAMKDRLNIKRFGYVECETEEGIIINAHEFHYSDIEGLTGKENYYFDISKPGINRSWKCGFIKNNIVAGYPHIHFYSNIDFYKSLILKAKKENYEKG